MSHPRRPTADNRIANSSCSATEARSITHTLNAAAIIKSQIRTHGQNLASALLQAGQT
jgi:hypothetical protein